MAFVIQAIKVLGWYYVTIFPQGIKIKSITSIHYSKQLLRPNLLILHFAKLCYLEKQFVINHQQKEPLHCVGKPFQKVLLLKMLILLKIYLELNVGSDGHLLTSCTFFFVGKLSINVVAAHCSKVV